MQSEFDGKNMTLGRTIWVCSTAASQAWSLTLSFIQDWIDGQMTETLGLNWQSVILRKEPEDLTGRQSLAVNSTYIHFRLSSDHAAAN